MIDYKKYKWFFTSNGLLVVGGKSAESNDDLIKQLKNSYEDRIVMHTSNPGSPFCAILADVSKVKKRDIEETSIFTGCFSQAWKKGLKETSVDIFRLSGLNKPRLAKTGTWQVSGKIETKKIKLELYLEKQKGVLRGVPFKTKSPKISPGKIEKEKVAEELERVMKFSRSEIIAALPAGGMQIIKP